MNRQDFSAPYLVALYKEHRRNPQARPSITELISQYELPRDAYFETQIYEHLSLHGWAEDPQLSTELNDARLVISFNGKAHAEKLLDRGVDPPLFVSSNLKGKYFAPAAGRIVSFSDNEIEVAGVRSSLAELAILLRTGNDVGNLEAGEVEEACRELWHLEQAFNEERVRLDWIEPLATISLRWVAEKAAGAAVGKAAVAALTAIAAWLASL